MLRVVQQYSLNRCLWLRLENYGKNDCCVGPLSKATNEWSSSGVKANSAENRLQTVKMMEGKPSSSKRRGRGSRGLAGLARLRQECHRFREEVACIRTLPRLQLRWPYLARLGEFGVPAEVLKTFERLFLELKVLPGNQGPLIHWQNTHFQEHRIVFANYRSSKDT